MALLEKIQSAVEWNLSVTDPLHCTSAMIGICDWGWPNAHSSLLRGVSEGALFISFSSSSP